MTAILTYPIDPPCVRRPGADESVVIPFPARGPGHAQPVEVYRRRRLVVVAVVLALFIGFMSFGRSAESVSPYETRSPDAIVVVVQPGDTLWAIASWLDPESDPRPLVDALSGIAGSNTLQPGQQLVIPSHLLE